MTYCTICGAPARDEARFCTACGARLADATPPESPTNTTALSGTDDEGPQSALPSDASNGTANHQPEESTTGETITYDPPAPKSPPTAPPSEVPGYAGSWPDANDSAAAPDATVDAGHHEQSAWHERTPPAPASTDERLGEMRRLIDELGHKVDQLGKQPAPLTSRDLDPDELAEALDGWSKTVPDTDVLLTAVQQVRKAPRNRDAAAQLSGHAADLEVLIQHYREITSRSATWAAKLRREHPARKRPGRRLGSMARDRTSGSSEPSDSAPDS